MSSQYRITVEAELRPGDSVNLNILGHRTWDVIDVQPGAEGLISARDAEGRELPIAGTVICRKADMNAPPGLR